MAPSSSTFFITTSKGKQIQTFKWKQILAQKSKDLEKTNIHILEGFNINRINLDIDILL